MSTSTDPRDAALRMSIPADRYAEILAHVVHFGPGWTTDVVARFGYALEEWREIDRAWTNGLANETALDEPARILSFSATFHRRRARLAQEKPTVESIVDNHRRSRRSVEPNVAAPTKPSGIPSFMLADAQKFEATGVSPWAAYSTPRTETSVAPLVSPPLAGKTPAEPLPFVQGVSAEAALQAAVEHAQMVQGAPSPPPAASLGETKALGDNDIRAIARQVIPFGSSSGPTNAKPAPDPELTLEQHAALYVELELYPERRADILRRYGLTASQYARIDTGWDAQLTLDPRLAATWQQLASQHRARLLASR